jgi:hypothetical protein
MAVTSCRTRTSILAALLASLASSISAAQSSPCERRILPPSWTKLAGSALAVQGNRAVIGVASSTSTPVIDRLLVYEKSAAGDWFPAAEIVPPPAPAPNFLPSLALAGTTIVLGQPAGSGSGPPGAVYLYEQQGGSYVLDAALASPTAHPSFGASVALDGDLLLVGASSEGALPHGFGSVHVYRRTSGVWTATQTLATPDLGFFLGGFGKTVRSSQGRAMVLGGAFVPPISFASAVAVYEDTPQGLAFVQALEGLVPGGSFFDVDLDGDRAISAWSHGSYGTGAVFHRRVGSSWSAASGQFPPGMDTTHTPHVAISGERAALSEPGYAFPGPPIQLSSGAVHVYGYGASGWTASGVLTAADASKNDLLGRSLAIDGTRLLAGSGLGTLEPVTLSGLVYEFDFAGACPALQAVPPSLSLSQGWVHHFTLQAGVEHAGDLYLLLASASGTSPGIAVDGLVLPLALDPWLLAVLQSPNQPPFAKNLGLLGAHGKGYATLAVPAGTDPALAGAILHHAFAVLDLDVSHTVELVSNATALQLLP